MTWNTNEWSRTYRRVGSSSTLLFVINGVIEFEGDGGDVCRMGLNLHKELRYSIERNVDNGSRVSARSERDEEVTLAPTDT